MTGHLLIHNARLIDPATGRDEPGGLLIENGLIAALGPQLTAATPAARVINANGKALAPGLIDLCVRIAAPDTPETTATSAAAGGVTTFVAVSGAAAGVKVLPPAALEPFRVLRQETPCPGQGVINAGPFATRLGLRGAPAEAEWTAIEHALALAEPTHAPLLADCISTARSLVAIERARDSGVKAACSVAAWSLFFNELDVGDYRTAAKVHPPFRAEADRMALIDGLSRGAIDAIVSAHHPQPAEAKDLPFDDAAFGAVGLETLLSALLSIAVREDIPLVTALKPLTSGPADLLDLPQGRLAVGAPADLVLFDPVAPWQCDSNAFHSRAKNSPFDGRTLEGRVLRTWVDGETVFVR